MLEIIFKMAVLNRIRGMAGNLFFKLPNRIVILTGASFGYVIWSVLNG